MVWHLLSPPPHPHTHTQNTDSFLQSTLTHHHFLHFRPDYFPSVFFLFFTHGTGTRCGTPCERSHSRPTLSNIPQRGHRKKTNKKRLRKTSGTKQKKRHIGFHKAVAPSLLSYHTKKPHHTSRSMRKAHHRAHTQPHTHNFSLHFCSAPLALLQ